MCTFQMCDEDRVFCLMFDKISVRKKLCSIHKFSCMVGFEDLGNHGRTSNIANHAMVFKLHGLYNKCNQPVAYCLIEGDDRG